MKDLHAGFQQAFVIRSLGQANQRLIARLRHAVPVPLVLHGSSGVADETIRAAIHAGITKVNVSTQLNRFFTSAVREYLATHPEVVDPRLYVREGRAAVTREAARLMTLLDAAGGMETPQR